MKFTSFVNIRVGKMRSYEVFVHGLHIKSPWSIENQFIELEKYPNEVHIEVSADQNQLYPCPECGKERQVRETVRLMWRHTDFFGLPCFVTANTPKIDCPDHGMVPTKIAWLRERNQLTVAQLAMAREPSKARRNLSKIINLGQIGMGGENCTREGPLRPFRD